MVLLIALVFSPVYSKYIRHYFVSFRLLESEVDNITDIFPGGDDLCSIAGKIKIPPSNHTVQVIHIMSKDCKSCVDGLDVWKQFPEILYKHLVLNQKKSRVEILHLINTRDSQDILAGLIKPVIDNDILKHQLKSVNTSLCLGFITHEEMKAMNINTLPTIMIIKDSNIYYSISRSVESKDLEKFSTIVSSLVK